MFILYLFRFNGYDGRLDRSLEAAVMIMESLRGFEDRFTYALVGHCGDGPKLIPFVSHSSPPENEKERFRVIQKMHGFSQYCMSGDHTLEAAEGAIRVNHIAKGECWIVKCLIAFLSGFIFLFYFFI